MAFPQTPLDFDVELLVGGEWTDITSDVYHRSPIVIQRGRQDQGSQGGPAKCSLVINNRTGKYSPKNPTGIYYGQIGRNTPLRVLVNPVITDTFTRTVVDGWGSTDTAEVWSLAQSSGTAADFDVASGKGTVSMGAVSQYWLPYLATTSFVDADATVTFSIPFTDVTGGDVEPCGVVFRGQSATSCYLARAEITSTESVTVSLHHIGGAVLAGPVTVPSLTHTAGQQLKLRAQMYGSTLRARVWLASGSEPASWHVSVTDTNITSAGWIGLRSSVSVSNTNALPIVVSIDDFEVKAPRFVGEVSEWPQRWDVTGTDVWVPIEASGIMRRLLKNSALKSAPYRFITSNSPKYYWPLTDGADTQRGEPDVPVGRSQFAALQDSPNQGWAAGNLSEWYEPVVSRKTNGTTGDRIGSHLAGVAGFVDEFTVDWLTRFGSGKRQLLAVLYDEDSYVEVLIRPDLQDVLVNGDFTGSDVDNPMQDEKVHHFRYNVSDSGSGTSRHKFYIDGVEVVNQADTFSDPPPKPWRIELEDDTATSGDLVQGHVALWFESPPSVTSAATACLGHQGENAATRITRLCSENGISASVIGTAADTTLVGPQAADLLINLLNEAANADGGILYESRTALGFAYRTRTSRYNQTVVLALNYASGHLSPPLEPSQDDDKIVNDMTVTRKYGSAARYEKTSGTLSTANPPNGVGRYDASETLSLHLQSDAYVQAGWRVNLGTVDELRYPSVHVDLAANTALINAIHMVDIGDRITISNPPAWLPPDTIDLQVEGYTELISTYDWDIVFNCVPTKPWEVGLLDDATYGRLETDGSELTASLTSGATTFDVVATGIHPVWTTDNAEFPFDVNIGGERLTVTDIAPSIITFVNAGTAAHALNASITPGLPASTATGDLLLVWCATYQSAMGLPDTPAGYTLLLSAGNARLFGKIHTGSESAPTITFTGAGDPNMCFSGQMVAFRGKFHTISNLITRAPLDLNPSGQNIAYPECIVQAHDSLILYLGWKQDDWTSVTSPGTEIGEPTTTLGNDHGLVWSYTIQTAGTDIAAGSFTVTGGASALSRGAVIALRCDKQTVTATRSVNGVVKAHSAGADMNLWFPLVLAL